MAVAAPETFAPGIYRMTAEQYHADPVPGGSLSSSGARKLLPPSCPAKFRYEQDHGQEANPVFDFGHAAHKKVLGIGPELAIVDADDWRTKAAREQRDEAYENGAVPLLAKDHDVVNDMAAALQQHPIASALFNPDGGLAEQNLFWRDAQTSIMRRARLDFLPETSRSRVIIPDYKTTVSAEPDALAKSMHRFGYHQQADWYLTGAQAMGLAGDDAAFVLVAQEKTPPYLVTVVEIDHEALRVGKARNRQAISIYEWCVENDRWPGYVDDITLISLPPWAVTEEGGDVL